MNDNNYILDNGWNELLKSKESDKGSGIEFEGSLGVESERSDEQNIYILGIETSCDDTSMVLMDFNGKIIENITWNQNSIHEKYQGIVPALASLYHLINIGEVWVSLENKYENLLNNFGLDEFGIEKKLNQIL